MAGENRLLAVVDAEGQREREELLAQARQRAAAVVGEAQAEAARIREAEISAPSGPAPDPRLTTATEAFLQRYAEAARALREATLLALGALAPETRARLLGSVAREVLADLPAGVYRVEAPQQIWEALTDPPPAGRSVRWSPGDGALALRSEDGTVMVAWGLETLVERYFQVEGARVARLLLGDEPG